MSEWALGGIEAVRWLLAAVVMLGWLGASAYWLQRRGSMVAADAEILIAHASQTGTAEALALIARERLAGEGQPAGFAPLSAIGPVELAKARRLIIFASTTGAGEAPDTARTFEQQVMPNAVPLPHLEVFILALGDRSYAHFCGFGRRLGDWAAGNGAQVSLIEVDNQSADDLARWDALMEASGLPQIGPNRAEQVGEWIILRRDKVANGDPKPIVQSRSGGLYHVTLKPANGAMPAFAIGDLFEWHSADGARRDFSIASTPEGGTLDLFIRQVELPGGAVGKASAVFTRPHGPSRVRGLIRAFTNFHETSGTGPLLAIAAGSGWAGIRPHILGAMARGRPVWLIYGERGPDMAGSLFDEMHAWQSEGAIRRLEVVLSRTETNSLRHVQASLAVAGQEVAAFLGDEGAVAICGAAAMGHAAERALADILAPEWIAQARQSHRWRVAIY